MSRHERLDTRPPERRDAWPIDAPIYATASTAGTGGRLRERPEDFIVEELPLYEPCGEGEHLYLFIEKREMDTPELVDLLAEHFGVRRSAVGVAGRKDRHAVSRQHASVHLPGRHEDDFGSIADDRVAVLWTDRHTNKLRTGQLIGNRFNIRIRGVDMSSAVRAGQTLRELATSGVPNLFGPQRFGAQRDNHLAGRDLLLGRLRRRMPREKRRFMLNALQSAMFNSVLLRRVESGSWRALTEGDLAFVHDSGAVFAVESPDAKLEDRIVSFDISPSGPMWGHAMMRASGGAGELERSALEEAGLREEDFAESKHAELVPGVRRPLRVRLTDPDVEGGIDEHGGYVRVAFDLPGGAYATAVLREIMKNELPGA
ncbi:MAG: tRNA pseudouridine(13) synthase TruD [Planctomycetota bacterium]